MIIIDGYMLGDDKPKEWIEYPGEYEKEGCDIRLKNGEEWGTCWPNAGKFLVLTSFNGSENLSFDESEVTHIRYYG